MKTKIMVAMLVILIMFAGGFLAKKHQNVTASLDNEIAAAKELQRDNNEQEIENKRQAEYFKRTVDSFLASLPGEYSVFVYNIPAATTYTYQNKAMPSASMIKMFILAKAYEEINKGTLSENEQYVLKKTDIVGGAGNLQGQAIGSSFSIKYLLEQMIVESDNVATNIIIDRLGMGNINAYIQQHGYKYTKLQRRMMDFTAQQQGLENYTSAADLGKIFLQLYRHTCVNATMDSKMLDILKAQTDNDKLPQGLPEGTVMAHKTGELAGVLNDGGIVYDQRGDYIIVVLANNIGAEATDNIAAISQKVYSNIFAKPTQITKPPIEEKSVDLNSTRSRLTREYALLHYGTSLETIVPQMIVLHWTAADTWQSTYNYFYPAENTKLKNGKLNVCSHYLVGRDGTIYQLTPENALNRHIIGYNWCAIGVENVGGVNSKEDLTEAQVKSNIALIRYLSGKYSSIHYVIGHYQQGDAKSTGLYKELVAGYASLKTDPGPVFMRKVRTALADTDLKFFRD